MSAEDGRYPFAERGVRARARREPAAGAGPAAGQPLAAEAGTPGGSGAADVAEDADILRDLRQSVRATVDEWLAERSHTISLAVVHVVEDALARMQAAHVARLRDVAREADERLAALERERAEAVRGALRRRRTRGRAVERDLREKIEGLERALTEASLESVERLREVERREAEARLEMERSLHARLREKDAEIDRLKRGGSPDAAYDSLHEQLRSRRPGGGGHEH